MGFLRATHQEMGADSCAISIAREAEMQLLLKNKAARVLAHVRSVTYWLHHALILKNDP